MKKLIPLALCAILCVFAKTTFADNEQETKITLAIQSAESWLGLIEENKYTKNWNECASFFKALVKKEDWIKQMATLKAQFGKNTGRKVVKTNYATSLPGAPDGEYVVIQFQSSFENKKSAVETVTPMLDKDGKWRVSGYFIK